MKQTLVVATLAVLTLPMTTACARNLDPAGADALWQRLQADTYTRWTPAPDYEDGPQPTVGAHGDTAMVYLNPVVQDALDAGASLDAWPVGSIIVKDSWHGDTELYRIAAMEKRETGWYWVEWDGAGQTLYSGSPETCTRCHADGDDLTLAVELP